jgi:acetyltransferase-like isoleucine patch superfamily enzyme
MSVQSEIQNHGLIIFRGQGLIGTGNKIVVGYNAVLDIGKNFKISDMCNIGCFREIRIGEQSRIVHRCQVFDSNYHYVANFVHRIVPNCIRPVQIGKGCWVCNSSTITGGAILPNYTIVGSNSLVNKDFSNIPESSMIGGVPAKFLATGFRKVENCAKKHKINLYYYNNPQKTYVIPELDTCDEYSFIDKFE